MKQLGFDEKHRIFFMPFGRIYPEYVKKAERKGRTKKEVDEILMWLTGYNQKEIDTVLEKETTIEDFLFKAPLMNPKRTLITGVVCGVRVEEIINPTMREIRYMDKLIDELAIGKPMEKILRN